MAEPAAGQLGVVVMAYGTPRSPEGIEPYYTHIRRGRPPTPELLAELSSRYAAIGGISPLAERSESQRAAIEAALCSLAPGRCRVVLGQRHAAPYIEDAVSELASMGVREVVGIVLAPHYSRLSVGHYLQRLHAAAAAHGMASTGVRSWHLEQAYLEFLAGSLREALADVPAGSKVLFTAHSLPEHALVADPYPDQLRASAERAARAVGLDPWAGWSLCWQSAGRTQEPWRGPDVLDVLRSLASTARAKGVVVCPQGFVADHLEVLYDLDIEARQVAQAAGVAFRRARVVNDDPAVMAALARRALEAARGLEAARSPEAARGDADSAGGDRR